ncbi:hypothetical protein J4212_02020 [Candidatus Woesearchaeota archaeon]|nr:hypothetical protein [Candidatus Woesearchaeota archaeon]
MKFSSTRKAQAWYADFIIGIFIFFSAITFYYLYTQNLASESQTKFNDVVRDAEDISSALILQGNPDNWRNETVVIIGLTDGNYRIDSSKWQEFANMGYANAKSLLGSVHDFYVFFQDNGGNVIAVGGYCGAGSSLVFSNLTSKAAYYYSQDSNSALKEFMEKELKADIYKQGLPGKGLSDLIAGIGSYSFIAMEHPLMTSGEVDSYGPDLESFAAAGNVLLLTGTVSDTDGKEIAGASYYKKASQAEEERNASTAAGGLYFDYSESEIIVFDSANYAVNLTIPEGDLSIVSEFSKDNKTAISWWDYQNGKVFFTSDIQGTYSGGDLAESIENAVRKAVELECSPVNISSLGSTRTMAKSERFVNYNQDIIRMEVYAWS